jgi:hypothetical protein
MEETMSVETPSGVPVPEAGRAAAEELARAVREATAGLPFGVGEPASFLAALERLATAEAGLE